MVLPPEIPREQVDVRKIPAREELWVFAKQCKQVFYIDPANKGRVVVIRGKRSIVGVAELLHKKTTKVCMIRRPPQMTKKRNAQY